MIIELFINADVMIMFLDVLENSKTISKPKTVYGIFKHVAIRNKCYNVINMIDWCSIIQTKCYFIKSKIIFAIEIPILMPNSFNITAFFAYRQ